MKKILLLLLTCCTTLLSAQTFYLGADLSYVNEMEDCGAVFYENQQAKDPYQIFGDYQANIARFRLWHTPGWTNYSNLSDVIKSIGRAKSEGMAILLDFHYSDTWADPANQKIPAAWYEVTNLNILTDSVYNYTFNTLKSLQVLGLLPDMVQIGNEINGNILLKQGEPLYPNNWQRNITLLQSGIAAVQAINQNFGVNIKTVIHIAQPENAVWWLNEAKNYGFTNYDIIGISYYPGWSNQEMRGAAAMVGQLKTDHGKDVMVVETGYPWTLQNADNAANILGTSNLLKTYSSTALVENQRDFLTDFSYLVKENGGLGVIYWEPAWVSTDCSTPWGVGSFYENATFFDFDYNLHEGIGFLNYDYSEKPASLDSVNVVFAVDMTGIDTTNGVFVTGDFTGKSWQFKRMKHSGQQIFEYSQKIAGRSSGAYIFNNKADWNTQSREPVPAECALMWDTHREFVIGKETEVFAYKWGTCTKIDGLSVKEIFSTLAYIYPNPADSFVLIKSPENICRIEIYNALGFLVSKEIVQNPGEMRLDISNLPKGVFFIKIYNNQNTGIIQKLIKK